MENKNEPTPKKESVEFGSEISQNISYKVRAEDGSLLAMDRKGIFSQKRYVFFAKDVPFHANDVVNIKFYGDPTKGCQLVYGYKEMSHGQYYLYANGLETSWNWIYWDKAGERPKDLLIKIRIEYAGKSKLGEQYKLIWDNNGTDMFLCRADNEWGYVSSKNYSLFTFHACFVNQNDILKILKNIWPDSDVFFNMKKENYEAINEITINEIYNGSGLAKYKFRDDSFTSEDFSYVYKSEASKYAYNKDLIHGYAVGIIYFINHNKTIGAVNVFIDALLNVYLFDPELRSIKKADKWEHIPFKIIM